MQTAFLFLSDVLAHIGFCENCFHVINTTFTTLCHQPSTLSTCNKHTKYLVKA